MIHLPPFLLLLLFLLPPPTHSSSYRAFRSSSSSSRPSRYDLTLPLYNEDGELKQLQYAREGIRRGKGRISVTRHSNSTSIPPYFLIRTQTPPGKRLIHPLGYHSTGVALVFNGYTPDIISVLDSITPCVAGSKGTNDACGIIGIGGGRNDYEDVNDTVTRIIRFLVDSIVRRNYGSGVRALGVDIGVVGGGRFYTVKGDGEVVEGRIGGDPWEEVEEGMVEEAYKVYDDGVIVRVSKPPP